jgi:hypothetical protein
MKQQRRIYYSAAQQSEIWNRWQAGEPMCAIGPVWPGVLFCFSVISPTGGIRPPDPRRFKPTLSLSERKEISQWLSMRRSLRSIALPGTICVTQAVKSIVMAVRTVIGLPGPIGLSGIGRGVPSFAIWLAVHSWAGRYRPGCGGNGHRSKSPVGSSAHIERHSRYVMLVEVANKDTESVVSALIKQSLRLPSELYRSLTWDRDEELADHQRLTLATEVKVYFCDPRSPWQRGQTKTPTDCCDNIFRVTPTYPLIARPSSSP